MTTSAMTVRPRPTLTALRAARMFDGTGALSDPTVIIDGAVILAAGRGLPVPDGAQLINMPGATILPGLVDGHVHLVFDASGNPVGRLAERDDAAVFAAAAGAARRAAQGGVTTVRDLGDRGFLVLGLRGAARTDATLPHILAAGPPITTPGGHCHFLGGSAAGAGGVRNAVRERVDRGVDVIKIMASGGNMTPGSRPELAQYTRDELRAAVTEAHRHGLAITAHAHGTSAITDAVAVGMDGLEHASFMTAGGVDEIPGELLATLGRGEPVLSLTFGIAPVSGAGPPPGVLARMPALIANARRMYRAGARIIVGSDAGLGRPSRRTRCVTRSRSCCGSACHRPRRCTRARPGPRPRSAWETARAASHPDTTRTCWSSTATHLPTLPLSTGSVLSTCGAPHCRTAGRDQRDSAGWRTHHDTPQRSKAQRGGAGDDAPPCIARIRTARRQPRSTRRSRTTAPTGRCGTPGPSASTGTSANCRSNTSRVCPPPPVPAR